jgi:hypothetical protein
MKKVRFIEDILPHIVAIAVFLLVTVFFFNPTFFDNKTLEQHDIQQAQGSSKTIQDFRDKTGEEALWADAVFSGMPAYLISVKWGNISIAYLKKIMSMGIPHPLSNIFLAFVCYYIMLLSFRVRPYLAIAGAIAFGLSSYMIIGLSAGHNGRIGAIAFMPLVMAGVHLAFTQKKFLGAGITATGIALHLRENHLQMTYYLFMIVLVYGLIRLIEAVQSKTLPELFKTLGLLVAAVLIGMGTFFGQFWAIAEYSAYSTRGKSDLAGATPQQSTPDALGMSKTYAFEYSNGILEPLTVLIPNIYGGASGNFLVQDPKSETYNALVTSGNEKMANQLARFTSAYWGPQYDTSGGTAPYYGGAIMVFLFALGVAFAEKKYVWWLVSLSLLAAMLSWGRNFSLNYVIFDYLPGYNKFRSVTFTMIIILFAMPLLGMLGLERLWSSGLDKRAKKKLLIVFASTGGFCFLFILFAGLFDFTNAGEAQFPPWFIDALKDDRKSLLRSDAFRSLAFITGTFILIYFDVHKKISPIGFYAFLIIMTIIDLAVVDKRYFTNDRFKRKRDNSFTAMTEADQAILADKSYYRVYNIQGGFLEARTSYHHYSVGGYHGAKLRRYQDFYDSCLIRQTQEFANRAQQGDMNFRSLGAFNMLNIKYIVYGPERTNIIPNRSANGNAWFVQEIVKVNSAADELAKTCTVDTRATAVIDASRFLVGKTTSDSTGTIKITDHTPRNLKYEAESSAGGVAVFSEIYYPEGWKAFIDEKEVPILRADYILRALEIPAGKHVIEFKFDPKAYVVGNKVTTVSSWLVLLILLGSIGWSLKGKDTQ